LEKEVNKHSVLHDDFLCRIDTKEISGRSQQVKVRNEILPNPSSWEKYGVTKETEKCDKRAMSLNLKHCPIAERKSELY